LSLSSLVARLADQVPTSNDGRIIVIVAVLGAIATVALVAGYSRAHG
jgi:hypothetical protein